MDEEHLLRGHTARMLAILSVGLAGIRLGRRTLPPLVPTIISNFTITPFEAGIALSLSSAGFALLQFPSGRLSDQLTRKTVLLISLSIVVVGSFLLFSATTFLFLLVGAVVVGIGEGLYGAADRGLLADLFTEKRGIVFGFHTISSDIGGILAAGLATVALAYGAWRLAFLPAIMGLPIIAALLYLIGKESLVVKPVRIHAIETAERLFMERKFQWLLLAYSLFAITLEGITGFLPALLQADHGFSPTLASSAFGIMFATGIIARPLGGLLSDGRNRLFIAGSGLLFGAIGVFVLVTSNSSLIAIAGIITFALGQKSFPPALQAHLMDKFPNESMGGDLGATRTVYLSIGSLGPMYVGYVASRLSYTLAFLGFGVAIFIAGIIVLGLAFKD